MCHNVFLPTRAVKITLARFKEKFTAPENYATVFDRRRAVIYFTKIICIAAEKQKDYKRKWKRMVSDTAKYIYTAINKLDCHTCRLIFNDFKIYSLPR